MNELIKKIEQWADDKGLLKEENATRQMLKVMEEMGETASALAKNDRQELRDGIGDVFVTMIILAKQCGFTSYDCLLTAWNEISDRKGVTVNGIFVKEE